MGEEKSAQGRRDSKSVRDEVDPYKRGHWTYSKKLYPASEKKLADSTGCSHAKEAVEILDVHMAPHLSSRIGVVDERRDH